jgi:hypothetical protein
MLQIDPLAAFDQRKSMSLTEIEPGLLTTIEPPVAEAAQKSEPRSCG